MAALLLATLIAAPSFAASEIDSRCDQVAAPSLNISVHELNAEIVSHPVESDAKDDGNTETPAHYLAPQVEATLRQAFDDSARNEAALENADDTAADEQESEERVMKTRVPGVTDSELERYRRQMYRIDI